MPGRLWFQFSQRQPSPCRGRVPAGRAAPAAVGVWGGQGRHAASGPVPVAQRELPQPRSGCGGTPGGRRKPPPHRARPGQGRKAYAKGAALSGVTASCQRGAFGLSLLRRGAGAEGRNPPTSPERDQHLPWGLGASTSLHCDWLPGEPE